MWTVVPLKALSPVKTRLASILSPEQRDGLMKAMVEDVLTALRDCPAVEAVLVVSSDHDIVVDFLLQSYQARRSFNRCVDR